MADIRALLAAERQARRISHPQLSYTKSGMLLCTICHLNVKSEALWDGHLRSANHKKNALAAQENGSRRLKRKIEDVEASPEESEIYTTEAETRKKARPQPERVVDESDEDVDENSSAPADEVVSEGVTAPPGEGQEGKGERQRRADADSAHPSSAMAPSHGPVTHPTVDEDEWAAFEREVAPLAAQPDYSAATISAAPLSAQELAAQAEEDRRRRPETEAEDEKEDEERRLEEEFEVMEEMEERVRKLRQQREALRHAGRGSDTGQSDISAGEVAQDRSARGHHIPDEDGEEDEEEEVDGWYQ